MTTRITSTQRAALAKLADGEWHSLNSFTLSTRRSLLDRALIDPARETVEFGSVYVDYRITNAGRVAIWSR
jgi:hypothetical protein